MYDILFKNCNVIYFKNTVHFKDLVGNIKGKIVITDSKNIIDICNIKGVMCVLNINTINIPRDKINCIVSGKIDPSLEANLIQKDLKIPVVYLEDLKKWCGVCYNYGPITDDLSVNTYCSDNCMKMHSGFAKNFKHETVIDDLEIKTVLSKYHEKPSVPVTPIKNDSSKFQRSMEKDAIRLQFAFKREEYKKEMRQPSLRKANISDKKKKVEDQSHVKSDTDTKICKGMTKKGEKCTNKSIVGSNFCGILSHSANMT